MSLPTTPTSSNPLSPSGGASGRQLTDTSTDTTTPTSSSSSSDTTASTTDSTTSTDTTSTTTTTTATTTSTTSTPTSSSTTSTSDSSTTSTTSGSTTSSSGSSSGTSSSTGSTGNNLFVTPTPSFSSIPTGATVSGGSSYWQTYTLVTTEINGQSTTIPIPTTLNIGPAEPAHNPMSSPGAIVGVVIGALAGLAILLFIFWRIRRRASALASLPYTRRRRDMQLEGEMYDTDEEEMTQQNLGPGVGRTTPGPYEYGVVGGLAPPSHEATLNSAVSHSPSGSMSTGSYMAAATPLVPASPYTQQAHIPPPAGPGTAYPYPPVPAQAAARREASSSGSIFREEGVWPPPQGSVHSAPHTPTQGHANIPPSPLTATPALGVPPAAAARQGHIRGASGSLGSRVDTEASGERESLIGGGGGYTRYSDDPAAGGASSGVVQEPWGPSGNWGRQTEAALAGLAGAAGLGGVAAAGAAGTGQMTPKQRERASILAQQAEDRRRSVAFSVRSPLSPTSGTDAYVSPTSAYPATVISGTGHYRSLSDPQPESPTIVQHLDGGRAPTGEGSGQPAGGVVELPPRYDQIEGAAGSRSRVRMLREKR
ncbi:hypothetical protein DACRYDRAFT_118558 [Dacryopinax primogenitus]|uniref:REJ domain-containing protein n=1 Tax=Dacryopinax primogenitus (strain DJM 731) TaxID=1858805 RepID=M5FSF1_DACPD|nr:uncharacterized protein DACRYDRAFT_118558 [Dacryopinax primogenitus]EJT98778.1 hypothetical protein DACRYDRAFT_118558 [Dacryopinax primogenitus]